MLPERPDKESRARVEMLGKIPAGSHIHMAGICGTGMGAVASLLKQLGFRITGSDKAFYPPMGDIARALAEKIYEGYQASNLTERPALVVIGNNLGKDNPEVVEVIKESLPFASMPEVFEALLIGSREECPISIVVSGTHGKSTTTAAIAVMLEVAGRSPGYFIGAVPRDLTSNIRPVDKTKPLAERAVVLEGDEYDSAWFAKWSKFHSYRPDIAIVTSLEFDHADIYRSIEDIEAEFSAFVGKVPADGVILVCDTNPKLIEYSKVWAKFCKARIEYYGLNPDSKYRLITRQVTNKGGVPAQSLVFDLDGTRCEVSSPLTGEHNALNLLVAAATGLRLGLSTGATGRALGQFNGVLRRQNVIGEWQGVLVIEDFAHHPTAIDTTLRGLREGYQDKRIIAVYEPRSNTSRRAFFQDDYPKAFSTADVTVISAVHDKTGYSKTGDPFIPLDVAKVVSDIERRGASARAFEGADEIASFLIANARPGDLICVMSNGDFGGLLEKLVLGLSGSQPTEARPAL